MVSGGHGIATSAQGGVGVHLPSQIVEEPESRHRDGRETGRVRPGKDGQQRRLAVPPGESVSDDVGAAGTKLHPEIIPKQLANLVMLRNCR